MKVALTTQEIISKLGLPEDTELVIEQSKNEWISNVGYDVPWYPSETLDAFTKIEVKFRNGSTQTGFADIWDDTCNWCELDRQDTDIVAYRVI